MAITQFSTEGTTLDTMGEPSTPYTGLMACPGMQIHMHRRLGICPGCNSCQRCKRHKRLHKMATACTASSPQEPPKLLCRQQRQPRQRLRLVWQSNVPHMALLGSSSKA